MPVHLAVLIATCLAPTTTPSRPAVSFSAQSEPETYFSPEIPAEMHTSRVQCLSVLVLLTVPLAVPAAAETACQLPEKAVLASVVLQEGKLVHQSGVHPGAVAHGVYVDSAHTASNFGQLRLVTSADHTDLQQLKAAGWLEGYLTAARINDHHHNLKHYFKHQLEAKLDKPMQWIAEQEVWLNKQVAAHPSDPFWQVVGLLQAQLDGLYEGYAAAIAAAQDAGHDVELLSRDDALFMNSNGELYDLLDMYEAEEAQKTLYSMKPHQLYMHLALQGKCSALIKVSADLSDIFFGHSTWDSFTAMTRIYKHYQFNLKQVSGGVAAQQLSFSSYPGELFSDDDLYITSSKMVVLETTNHIYNFTILEGLSPKTVPSWQRVRAANLLAADGRSWVETFKRHNSGTYNNQYMVVDLKRFEPRRQLQPGLLWVVEQLPGMVEAADMTTTLSRGYWPSYNVAYFPKIYKAAGYPDILSHMRTQGVQEYADPMNWLLYQVSPRANIFRRDQGGVSSLDDLKHLMRSNDYQHDKLSGKHPVAAVCSRGDLATTDAIPKGCYDTKVTSYKMAIRMESEVIGGPTSQSQPVFEWGNNWPGFEHRGMPDRYDFQFERQSAANLPLPGIECSMEGLRAAAASRKKRPVLALPRLTAAQRERLRQQQLAQI